MDTAEVTGTMAVNAPVARPAAAAAIVSVSAAQVARRTAKSTASTGIAAPGQEVTMLRKMTVTPDLVATAKKQCRRLVQVETRAMIVPAGTGDRPRMAAPSGPKIVERTEGGSGGVRRVGR